VPPVTHTHALFADQSQSILANRMELSGQGRACNGSAEAAQRSVVIISIKPVSEAAKQWVDQNVVSEPWQWLGGALCVDVRCARHLVDEIAAQGFGFSL